MVTTQSHAPAQALNVDQTLQQAIGAHRLGQFQEAHRLYGLILQAQPHHPDAHHNLGALALQHGQAAIGLPHFQAAWQARPDYPQYWLSYANALIEVGQFDTARQLLAQPIPPAVPGDAVQALVRRLPAAPVAPDQTPEQTLQALVPLFTRGRYAELESPARELTQRHPHYGLGWKLLAAALKLQARPAEALGPMQQTVALLPGDPENHNNLGGTLSDLGRLAEAESCFRHAIQLNPRYADAHFNLGNTLRAIGRLDEAVACYRQALALTPNNPSVHTNLGCALADLGQGQAAEASFRQALALARDHVEALSNLGNTLLQRGELAQAEALQRQALQLRPDYTLALCNLGSVLHAQDRPDEALQSLQQALALQPDNFDALASQGAMLHGQGRANEAQASLRQALALQPGSVNTLANLGLAQYAQDRPDEALATLSQALAIKPDYVNALSNLGNTLCVLGRLDEGEAAYCRALELKPDDVAANSNRLFGLNYHPDRSAEEIFAAYQAFEQHVGRAHRTTWRAHDNDRNAARRLRVGYVSPDFKLHSCRHFLEPLLAQHDRQDFEVFAYAQLDYEDELTARYKTYVDHWVSTRGLSDDALAARIRADGIDILVDVAGHTSGNRLGVFARKPAPVSVSWLGYGYTTGLTAIDYYLCDAHSVPADAQRLFSETPWRLPVGWAYRAGEGMGDVSPLPALERGYVTFGTLTRRIRINHRTIAAWSAILKRVNRSKLVIDSSSFRHAYAQSLLQQQFAEHGIGPERLQLGCHTPPWDTLRGIDIGLDCFPHNSGTTLFETLYMGVPFVTLAGRPSVGRIGSAILHAAGHPEWIANTEDDYVQRACALASDTTALASVRATLRGQLHASRLMDEPAFAKSVQDAYHAMFEVWAHRLVA